MFAVIRTGGKQYKVAAGDKLMIERVLGEPGNALSFDDVLMLHDGKKLTIGAPVVEGAAVQAKLLKQFRGDKVIAFKKRRRKNSRRKIGHRQNLSLIQIEVMGIGLAPVKNVPSATVAAEKTAVPAQAEVKAAKAKAPTATKTDAKEKAAPKAAAKPSTTKSKA